MVYSRFIDKEARISKSLITPGNLYRISSYSYSDGEARAQTGPNSSLVFVFGIHEKKLNCLKLNDVSPDIFKNWLKTLLKPALKSEDIDSMKKLEDVILESDIQGNKLFESKIKVAKDRITLENSQLIEESTDIDSHIQMFKNDLNKNKIQEAKIKM